MLAAAAGAAAAAVFQVLATRTAAAAPSAPASTKPATRPARDTAIHKLEEFYAKIYGEPLEPMVFVGAAVIFAGTYYSLSRERRA